MPPGGLVENTSPPSAGRVATAEHGIETSSARGAPDTRGAVMSLTVPSALLPCGQEMVAVVWLTGSKGVSPHSTSPRNPATSAMTREGGADTRLDGMRRT